MTKVRASLIIPTRDNIPFLSNAIESALETMQAEDEIIIVGNGTEDEIAVTRGYAVGMGSASAARKKANVRFIQTSTPGYTTAINAGLLEARGDYLIIGNDDVVFAPKWLDELIDAGARASVT